MLFSARIPLAGLVEMCRVLRHNLSAGLTLRDVFRQLSRKGPLAARPVAGRILEGIEQGDDLASQLEREQAAFPPLFRAMAGVGEQTGNLAEIFHELEKYYRLQQKLWRMFVTQSIRPIIQFIMAVFVIAAMILVLGWIAQPGQEPMDPLGVGLTGEKGAILFIVIAFGSVGLLLGTYLLLSRSLRHKATVDRFLLRLPVFGPCLRALAMTRFCLALRLTLETGMPLKRALRLTMRATGNAAFEERTDVLLTAVEQGEELSGALAATGMFGIEFLNIMEVAEEGGRVTEVMEQQVNYYQEESERKLTILTQMASWGTWLVVAILIVIAIFRIFFTVYAPLLNA